MGVQERKEHERQSLELDVISGATVSSKSILKAAERAVCAGL